MADTGTKLPVKTAANNVASAPAHWPSVDNLRRQMDRFFDRFSRGLFESPARFPSVDLEQIWQGDGGWAGALPVDIVEKDGVYEVAAELPGMDEKNVEVTVADGVLSIKGEKTEDKEEKKKGYHLSERRFGSFQRSFTLPDGVDAAKIQATIKSGVLTVTLPKTAEAQKQQKINVKAA